MANRRSLFSRLDALEDRLISPLDRAIEQLSDADRQQYDRWRQRCSEHFSQYEGEPGGYFAAVLDGKIERPRLAQHVARKLFPDVVPDITLDDDEATAQQKWNNFRENRR